MLIALSTQDLCISKRWQCYQIELLILFISVGIRKVFEVTKSYMKNPDYEGSNYGLTGTHPVSA